MKLKMKLFLKYPAFILTKSPSRIRIQAKTFLSSVNKVIIRLLKGKETSHKLNVL